MTGFRNRLAHAYISVDLTIVWLAVTQELPELILQLDDLIAILPPE